MERRRFLVALAVPLGVALGLHTGVSGASPDPYLRVRRRVRHRIRRRVVVRTVHGRPFLVVPSNLAAGWELQHLNRVVIVRDFRFVEVGGVRSEVAVVLKGGIPEEIPIVREDTHDNSKNLAGSAIDDGELATPSLEDSARE
jgi:hypothetical protein